MTDEGLEARIFTAALAMATRDVVEHRNTIPVLGCVLLEAGDDVVRMTCTDLDFQVTANTEAPGVARFRTAVPAKALLDIASGLPDAVVAFQPPSDADPRLALQAGRSVTHIAAEKAEFPHLQPVEPVASFEVAAAGLVADFKALAPYMAKHSKPSLSGINVRTCSEGVELIACDGERFSRRVVAVEVAPFEPFTIPRRAALWLSKRFPRDGLATIAIHPDRLTVAGDGVQMATKPVKLAYPDVSRLRQDGEGPAVRVAADQLSQAADLVMACSATPRGKRVVLVDFAEGELRLSCRDYSGATGETWIDAIADDEAEVRCALPGAQIVAALKTFANDDVVELRNGFRGALTIRSTTEANREALIAPAGSADVHDPSPRRLERPVVRVSPPAPVDDSEPGGVTSYTVQVARFAGLQTSDKRSFRFPSYAKACKAYVRHLAALETSCDVDPQGERYAWDTAGGTADHDWVSPVTWLTREQRSEIDRRAYAIQRASGVFEATDSASIPWPRAACFRPFADRLEITPEATIASRWRPLQIAREYAGRVLRDANWQPAPEPVVAPVQDAPQPIAAVPATRVRIWASEAGAWGYEGRAFEFSGLGSREAAVRHAIAAHPASRIVLTAAPVAPPASNIVPLRRRLAPVSRFALTLGAA